MSLPFSDTTNKSGILQLIEGNCGFNDGDITGNTTRLKKFTAAVNLAHDFVLGFVLRAAGWKWQPDDINHTGLPVALINLVSGTRTYAFSTDSEGSYIVDVYKVMILKDASSGEYIELENVDATTADNMAEFNDGLTRSGVPTKYTKTGNRITFNVTPNYSATNGIKVLVSREGTYFTTSDTTKRPGIAHLFHEWYVLKPSYDYARTKGLQNVSRLEKDMNLMQKAIEAHYGAREKDAGNAHLGGRKQSHR